MNRYLTNSLRYFLDEFLPPLIRDNRIFMYPFFYIWFKGKNIKKIMEFKSLVYKMSFKEFADFYNQRDSLARDRPTDLNERTICYMLENISKDCNSLIDIGCGNGYFLSRVSKLGIDTWGSDIDPIKQIQHSRYVSGNIECLPFTDKEFDVVTCHHTLEHIINIDKAISELKRIAKKRIIIVIPCQRYYYYTLDEHLHFFPHKELLIQKMGMGKFICKKIFGDWVYIGNID